MKKFFAYLKEKRTLSALLVIFSAIIFYMLLSNLGAIRKTIDGVFSVLSPLVAGALIAYLLDPFAAWLERVLFKGVKNRKAAWALSVSLGFILVVTMVIVLIATLVPQVLQSLTMLLSNIGTYYDEAEKALTSLAAQYPMLGANVDGLLTTARSWLDKITTLIADNLDKIIETSVSAGGKVVNFALAVIFSIYIILDKQNIFHSIRRWSHSRLTLEQYDKYHALMSRANHIFIGFLGGNVLDSIIIGLVNFIVMKLLGMPYVLLISAIVGVTNFIPTFGPIIGAIPCALILLLIDPWDALWFLILTVVLQTADAYVIKPLLFGDITGLRPLWVMAAVIVGGRLFGVWGMIFGIPLLAVISELLREGVNKRLAQRGLDADGNPLSDPPPDEPVGE